MSYFQDILAYAVKHGASDIHLTVGSPPAVRIDGTIHFIQAEKLMPKDTEAFLEEMTTEEQRKDFHQHKNLDMALGIPNVGRFRVNLLRQRGSIGIVMRLVKGKILDFAMLHLPPAMEKVADMRRGLVLVTGTMRSGKSTTLASIIDWINQRHSHHIIMLEDPIEFLHRNKKAIITQREISIDTSSNFQTALRAAMREDPDVIFIGEMRDYETFQAAIAAAETGHLVFCTLNTTNVIMTLEHILDLAPAHHHDQVRLQLSQQLRACVAQRLLPTPDGKGRIPAVEIMFNSSAIAALIRENNLKQIPLAIAAGKEEGMQSLNMSLVGLVREKLVTEEEALLVSDNPDDFKMNLQGIYLGSTRGAIPKE